MARLLANLSKGQPLEPSDRKLLESIPLADLKALLKVCEKTLHPSTLAALQEILSPPEPIVRRKKRKKRGRPGRSGPLGSLIHVPSFEYFQSLSAPKGSIRTVPGGSFSPR